MKITLIRHAEVLVNNSKKINYKELLEWLKQYDIALINKTLPSSNIKNILNNSNYILASNLPRTTNSLKLLNIEPNIKKRLFNELELTSLNPDYVVELLYILQMLCSWVFVKNLSLTQRLSDDFL